MEMLQRKKNVCRVELGSILFEPTNLTEVEKQFSTWAVLKAEVEPFLIMERVVHLDNKVMVHTFLYYILETLGVYLPEYVFPPLCAHTNYA